MLHEYTKYWDAYIASAGRIHSDLFGVGAALNQVYEQAYPSHPCFPKFSFLRLLISIWRHEVFASLKERLFTHTFDYITRHRKKIRKYGMVLKTKRKKVNESEMASSEVEIFLRSNTCQGEIME